MPISADQFDRIPDPNQTEKEALIYPVMQLLRENPDKAFRIDEITANLMGRPAKGFDLEVAIAKTQVEGALELLIKQGHVEMKTAGGYFGVQYYRAKR